MTILERRVAAAQAALDHFRDKPFAWGTYDCASLGAYTLRQLDITSPLRSFGSYQTALGAKRALKRKGFDDLSDVLDDMGLPRIPHAYLLPCDLVGTPGKAAWGTALAVYLGNGRFLGFAEDLHGARAGVITLGELTAAWRVI